MPRAASSDTPGVHCGRRGSFAYAMQIVRVRRQETRKENEERYQEDMRRCMPGSQELPGPSSSPLTCHTYIHIISTSGGTKALTLSREPGGLHLTRPRMIYTPDITAEGVFTPTYGAGTSQVYSQVIPTGNLAKHHDGCRLVG